MPLNPPRMPLNPPSGTCREGGGPGGGQRRRQVHRLPPVGALLRTNQRPGVPGRDRHLLVRPPLAPPHHRPRRAGERKTIYHESSI
eukprot:1697670-Pyramimonas_sp.AAC.1